MQSAYDISYKRKACLKAFVRLNFAKFCDTTMTDFPVIGNLVMRIRLWDRQRANIASRYKEMHGVEVFLR